MAIDLDDFLSKLSSGGAGGGRDACGRVDRGGGDPSRIAKSCARSQEQIAERLHIKQPAVSKLERRTDMYISTLRDMIRAMGGDLDIIARFPDRPSVRITQFKSLKGKALSQ